MIDLFKLKWIEWGSNNSTVLQNWLPARNDDSAKNVKHG